MNIVNLHRLSILDVVIYSNGSYMPVIKEMEQVERFTSMRTNIYKNTIVLFISELLIKSVREEEANGQLFDFLTSSISVLEHISKGEANFHIHFLVHFCKMLGFMPTDNFSQEMPIFNMLKARFCEDGKFFAGNCFSIEQSALLHTLLNTQAINCVEIKCSGEMRLAFAKQMIRYLSHHLSINLEIKSLDVLHEVLN